MAPAARGARGARGAPSRGRGGDRGRSGSRGRGGSNTRGASYTRGGSRGNYRTEPYARNPVAPPVRSNALPPGRINSFSALEEAYKRDIQEERDARTKQSWRNMGLGDASGTMRQEPEYRSAAERTIALASQRGPVRSSKKAPKIDRELVIDPDNIGDNEPKVGQRQRWPVLRPYHLGGMGRYGIDIPIDHDTDSPARTDQPMTSSASVDQPMTSSIPDDSPHPQRDYMMPKGIHKGKRMDHILADESYLRGLGSDDSVQASWKGLRAALEYHCPQYITTSAPDLSKLAVTPPSSSPKDYIFPSGKFKGERLDTKLDEKKYLKHISKMFVGKWKGLEAALQYHCPNLMRKSASDGADGSSMPQAG